MKIKILLLLLALSLAACGGNSEPVNEITTTTSEQVSIDEVESKGSTETNDPPETSTDVGVDGLRNPGDIIERFDENGDGVLQLPEAPVTLNFEEWDANADGIIDDSEVPTQTGRPSTGERPAGASQRGAGSPVTRFDADDDGLISRVEAPEVWSFDEYDVNGDGYIDTDEAEQIQSTGNRNRP